MMKKYFFFLTFLISSIGLVAQCPINVTVTTLPDVSQGPVCKSTLVQLTATPSAGAIGNVTQYVWVIGNDTLSVNNSTVNVLANSQSVLVYMQTTTGCIQDTVSNTLQIETVIIESIATPILTECNQNVADVQVTTTGNGSPSYTYEITDVGSNSDGFFNDVSEGTYRLFTTDSKGCKDTAEVIIVPFKCPPPIPREVITPNEDGFNDTWQISNIQFYPENEVFIFDRWGQRVYNKKGYDNADGWDAKYLGVGLPVSTYYYLLEIKPENGGDDIIMRGPISVFR
jgi:gliding motility-associated-like protein